MFHRINSFPARGIRRRVAIPASNLFRLARAPLRLPAGFSRSGNRQRPERIRRRSLRRHGKTVHQRHQSSSDDAAPRSLTRLENRPHAVPVSRAKLAAFDRQLSIHWPPAPGIGSAIWNCIEAMILKAVYPWIRSIPTICVRWASSARRIRKSLIRSVFPWKICSPWPIFSARPGPIGESRCGERNSKMQSEETQPF